ncbi:MAG: hypothetical protein IT236_10505 [Bacteroidia bacterium]|nr:hypothetical protein [Bacteroidia bacterium]
MWKLLELIAVAALLLVSITEFFYPIIAGKPLFGSFRKKKETPANGPTNSLDEKLNEAKQKVNDIKEVQNEVQQHYKTAKQLKEEADQLINNTKKQ